MSLDIGWIPNTPVQARASAARFASCSSLAHSSSEIQADKERYTYTQLNRTKLVVKFHEMQNS